MCCEVNISRGPCPVGPFTWSGIVERTLMRVGLPVRTLLTLLDKQGELPAQEWTDIVRAQGMAVEDATAMMDPLSA